MTRIALNGLGRIGKLVLRDLIDTGAGGEIVLINDPAGTPVSIRSRSTSFPMRPRPFKAMRVMLSPQARFRPMVSRLHCSATRSSCSMDRAEKARMRRFSSEKALANASPFSASVPGALTGSGTPQCAVIG